MNYLRIVLLLLFILPLSVNAARTYGFGNNSCGQWTNERRSNSITSRYQQVWVLGFISGTGVILEAYDKKQTATDADAATAYIDKYCGDHPLSSIMEASQMLMTELWPSK